MLIYKRGALGNAGVDREFILMFTNFNEQQSWYYANNNSSTPNTTIPSINGQVYGNLEGIWMWQGEKIRWHLAAVSFLLFDEMVNQVVWQ